MFDFLSDIAEGVGTVIGTVVGVPLAIAAIGLGFSKEVVDAAIEAGCTTIEEIKDFANNL